MPRYKSDPTPSSERVVSCVVVWSEDPTHSKLQAKRKQKNQAKNQTKLNQEKKGTEGTKKN
jgi:hypothetical protein